MFRLKKYPVHSLPKAIRRQFAPDPGMIEPAFPSRTKLVRVRVDRACLWSVCKTSSLAMVLIVIGAGMAVIGFYAPELSSYEVTVGNSTLTSVKTNEKLHWHLKTLTYVGPAFMGLGSVVIVAICVMTFEARDKAAKICPEDPPRLSVVKDELCVNVIKNLVRKYSGVPKIAPSSEEQEDARLIPIYSASKTKRSSHFLETPVDYALGTRCVSEPCVAVSSGNSQQVTMQLPAVRVSCQEDSSPPPRLSPPSQPPPTECHHLEKAIPLKAAAQPRSTANSLPSAPSSAEPSGAGIVGPNITACSSTSGSSGVSGTTRRQSTVSRETVVDIHPLPALCGDHDLSDSPTHEAESCRI